MRTPLWKKIFVCKFWDFVYWNSSIILCFSKFFNSSDDNGALSKVFQWSLFFLISDRVSPRFFTKTIVVERGLVGRACAGCKVVNSPWIQVDTWISSVTGTDPWPGMVTIKFWRGSESCKGNLNQVSSISLLMTSSMALANKGLFELTLRQSLTQAVTMSFAETTKESGCT